MGVEDTYLFEQGGCASAVTGEEDDCHNDSALAGAWGHDQQVSGSSVIEPGDGHGSKGVLAGVWLVVALAHDLLDAAPLLFVGLDLLGSHYGRWLSVAVVSGDGHVFEPLGHCVSFVEIDPFLGSDRLSHVSFCSLLSGFVSLISACHYG